MKLYMSEQTIMSTGHPGSFTVHLEYGTHRRAVGISSYAGNAIELNLVLP